MNRTYNNLIAILIVVLVLALMLVLGGCMTKYEIHKNSDGSVDIMVQSYREFDKPKVIYSRDGADVEFQFNAEKATTATSPIEQAFADGIRAGAIVIGPSGVQP